MGFFVRTDGVCTNTYFVTARHCLAEIRAKGRCEAFDLRVAVKRRGSEQSTEILIPCNGETATETELDIAVIQVRDGQLNRPDIDVAPLVLCFPKGWKERSSAEPEALGMAADQAGFVTAQRIQTQAASAAKAEKKQTLQAILPRSGKPGFLLYSSRAKHHIERGSEIFVLVSHACYDQVLGGQLFSIFLRKGIISYFAESLDGYEATGMWDGSARTLLIVDCQTARGNSGAPVFVPVRERLYGGRECLTPHVLGIIVRVVKAKGTQQELDLSLQEADGEKKGRIRGSPVFEENTGLSVVIPADYLVLLLMEIEHLR